MHKIRHAASSEELPLWASSYHPDHVAKMKEDLPKLERFLKQTMDSIPKSLAAQASSMAETRVAEKEAANHTEAELEREEQAQAAKHKAAVLEEINRTGASIGFYMTELTQDALEYDCDKRSEFYRRACLGFLVQDVEIDILEKVCAMRQRRFEIQCEVVGDLNKRADKVVYTLRNGQFMDKARLLTVSGGSNTIRQDEPDLDHDEDGRKINPGLDTSDEGEYQEFQARLAEQESPARLPEHFYMPYLDWDERVELIALRNAEHHLRSGSHPGETKYAESMFLMAVTMLIPFQLAAGQPGRPTGGLGTNLMDMPLTLALPFIKNAIKPLLCLVNLDAKTLNAPYKLHKELGDLTSKPKRPNCDMDARTLAYVLEWRHRRVAQEFHSVPGFEPYIPELKGVLFHILEKGKREAKSHQMGEQVD